MGLRRNSRAGTVGAIALATVGLTGGCASKACTLIGAESGARIQLDAALTADQALTIRACLTAKYCNDAKAEKGESEVFVPIGQLSGSGSVSLTVSALLNGTTIKAETVSVVPTSEEPNGPGCDPKVWIAAVHLSAAG